jgi:lysyl-tRNA synthetase class 2
LENPLPWWHPTRFAERRAHLEARARIAADLRACFAREGFVEVETPALQVSPGLEPHLFAFETRLRGPAGARETTRYLHTSPEFAMKKLLVAGVPRLFQLSHAFRNRERSSTHHPEFTMLEWYRAGADYRALMDDCEALLRVALEASGRERLVWRGAECDPRAPAERLTVARAFETLAGCDVFALAPRDGDTYEDQFFRVFLNEIEPKLGIGRPTLLYDWPIALGALARGKPGDPRVADRVELYVCGLELANGFSELTDAAEQRRRFERDLAEKARLYGERYPIDPDFLAALEHGLPASAGMALGFDRLVMCATGAERIDDVLWAPVDEDEADHRRGGAPRRARPAERSPRATGGVALGGRAHARRPGGSTSPTLPIRSASSCRAKPSSRRRATSSTTRSATPRSRRSRASPIAIPTACC